MLSKKSFYQYDNLLDILSWSRKYNRHQSFSFCYSAPESFSLSADIGWSGQLTADFLSLPQTSPLFTTPALIP